MVVSRTKGGGGGIEGDCRVDIPLDSFSFESMLRVSFCGTIRLQGVCHHPLSSSVTQSPLRSALAAYRDDCVNEGTSGGKSRENRSRDSVKPTRGLPLVVRADRVVHTLALYIRSPLITGAPESPSAVRSKR